MHKLLRSYSQQNLKDTARKMLEEYKSIVFETDSINTWLERVMKNPKPVVLQAYANWSIPCRKIMPILERKTLEADGKWCYTKLDIDELPDLATALQVSLVPTIFLINQGHSINRVEGILTEEQINEFIDDVKVFSGLTTDEMVVKGLILAGNEFIAEKKYDEAITSFEKGLKVEEFGESVKQDCWLGLAKSYFYKGLIEKAEEFVKKLSLTDPEVQEIAKKIEDFKTAADRNSEEFLSRKQALEDLIQQNNEDYALMSKLAMLYHMNNFHEEAIETALKTISLEQSFKGFGHKAIITILNNLGPSHILTKPTRKKLQVLQNKFSV